MTGKAVFTAVGIAAAAISAICWFWASVIKPSYPMGYIGGPPQEVIDRMNLQARLNAIAAAATGATAICQAALMALPS